jgi:S-adenosylmethionine hydrolase
MITLLTDFGTADAYVGIMKGVILSVSPSAVIIDLTHEIAPQDILGAAYVIDAAYRFFPAGTIHLVVVDPGVGTDRGVICVSANGHFFLAPDNGVLTRIISPARPDAVFVIDNNAYFLDTVSRTFHGRDVFAPVAGHLDEGVPPDRLGRKITAERLHRLDLPEPRTDDNRMIAGQVIMIDRFGNLITNIDYSLLRKTFEGADDRNFQVTVGTHRIQGLSSSYQAKDSGGILAIVGSSGFVEISVNTGSAAAFCKAMRGTAVSVAVG